MSSYLLAAEFIDRFSDREARALTDRANTGSTDPLLLQRGLDEASTFVDGYLARRYAIPLVLAVNGAPAGVPEILKRIVGDVARFQMTGTHVICTDEIRDRYKIAEKLLEKIAAGDVGLGVELQLSSSPSAPLAGATSVRTRAKEFGGCNLGELY